MSLKIQKVAMAWSMHARNLSIILALLVGSLPEILANKPPQITIGLPYSGKKGVLIHAEDTPLNSYLAIMEAKDNDTGLAGEVECKTENSYIKIDLVYPKTYKVALAKELDRETTDSVQVSIACTDKGDPPLKSTGTFSIEIVDINDNAPIFDSLSYNASVTEGVAIGTSVTTVTATDPDAGLNGVVRYSLAEADGNFGSFVIDNNTGEIFTSTDLDREAVNVYVITVVATDSGLPALSSTAQVKIKVKDFNDNTPVITTTQIHTKENQKPMSQVGKLNASDLDSGKNAELVFSKVEDSESSSTTPFLVHPGGEILSAVSLDREQRPQYSMAVAVRDKGNPRLSSTATITIIVDDVNDNAPIITSSCLGDDDDDDDIFGLGSSTSSNSSSSGFVTIDWFSPEDERIVHQIEAQDPDAAENSRLIFAVHSASVGDSFNTTITKDLLFEVDEESGEISLGRFVRKNDHLRQILNVSVTDRGNPALTTFCSLNITINVTVTDLVSHPPKSSTKIRHKAKGRLYRNGASVSSIHALKSLALSGHVVCTLSFTLVSIYINAFLKL